MTPSKHHIEYAQAWDNLRGVLVEFTGYDYGAFDECSAFAADLTVLFATYDVPARSLEKITSVGEIVAGLAAVSIRAAAEGRPLVA